MSVLLRLGKIKLCARDLGNGFRRVPTFSENIFRDFEEVRYLGVMTRVVNFFSKKSFFINKISRSSFLNLSKKFLFFFNKNIRFSKFQNLDKEPRRIFRKSNRFAQIRLPIFSSQSKTALDTSAKGKLAKRNIEFSEKI